MASGWNLWVWLQCIGVVSGCCCKEVYTCTCRYPHNITNPYSTCINFFCSSIPTCTSLFIFLMVFFVLVYNCYIYLYMYIIYLPHWVVLIHEIVF